MIELLYATGIVLEAHWHAGDGLHLEAGYLTCIGKGNGSG
jgi:site-specific recombinase XerD